MCSPCLKLALVLGSEKEKIHRPSSNNEKCVNFLNEMMYSLAFTYFDRSRAKDTTVRNRRKRKIFCFTSLKIHEDVAPNAHSLWNNEMFHIHFEGRSAKIWKVHNRLLESTWNLLILTRWRSSREGELIHSVICPFLYTQELFLREKTVKKLRARFESPSYGFSKLPHPNPPFLLNLFYPTAILLRLRYKFVE